MQSFLTILALLSSAEASIIGTYIFSRHGDRLAKPANYLTPLGAQQLAAAGDFYHDRYFNNSTTTIEALNETYNYSQVYAAAPNAGVLQKSQISFLQGLYPPIETLKVAESSVPGSSLSNGSYEYDPLDGYQFVFHYGYDTASPNGMWLQGSSNCPAYTEASKSYFNSTDFLDLNASTLDFYQSLESVYKGVYGKKKLNYGNAYSLFDYWNVNYIHNETFKDLVDKSIDNVNATALQVKTLADLYSKSLSYNESNLNTTIGGMTLAGSVLTNLNLTLNGGQTLSYVASSYDIFYALFGVLDLYKQDEAKWTGMVNYAASLVFELSDENDQGEKGTFVTFGFRNGSDSDVPLEFFPVLDFNSTYMDYDDFKTELGKKAIMKLEGWCDACQSYDSFQTCAAYSPSYEAFEADGDSNTSSDSSKSSLSLADAGGIGAGTTIGVIAILGAIAFVAMKKMRKSKPAQDVEKAPGAPIGKTASGSTQAGSV